MGNVKNSAKTVKVKKNAGADAGKNVKQPIPSSPLRAEIFSIILFAAGLLLFIIIYLAKNSGFLGGFFKTALRGCLGFGAYALPFVAILWGIVVVCGKSQHISKPKLIMGIFLFLTVISFIHILNSSPETVFENAADYISQNYSEASFNSGGLFGALVGDALLKFLGKAGAYVLLGASAVVLAILVTGKSLFSFLVRTFSRIDGALEKRKNRKHADAASGKAIILESMNAKKVNVSELEPYPNVYGSGGKTQKRAFDYVIDGEDENNETDEIKIHLINDELKRKKDKYPRALKPDAPPSSENKVIDMRADKTAPETDKPPFDADGEPYDGENAAEDYDSDAEMEISVKGVGVEGYVPITVTTAGEDFVDASAIHPAAHIPKAPSESKSAMLKKSFLSSDEPVKEYVMPSVNLLTENTYTPSLSSRAHILENSRKLEETLKSFGVEAKVVEVSKGPTVTRYELSPGVGVKVSRISSLSDDLALSLAALGIRIEAPIPGKSVVGIEIPNKEVQTVFLRDVVDDDSFWSFPSKLSFAVGKDIAGNTVIVDIARMPHLLIAGATGSGKSVCVNTIIASILFKARPDEVKMLMIDPKVVELNVYNGIPHLEIPVVTDPMKAAGALNWGVREMNDRYNLFAKTGVRDLRGYNAFLSETGQKPLPQILIIIDELADLMMTCRNDVEQNICRLAQKARAAGIHLIIATQRPSVDVITGLIKANIPSRLAFAVSSGTDSRTILDMVGAEKLLGKGDMLFSPAGLSKPQRIQGAFISDKEVERLVTFVKKENGEMTYDPEKVEEITAAPRSSDDFADGSDELIDEAIDFVIEKGKASVSMLQRRFRIGYNRAARMMEELEARGIVGPEDGVKPRKVLKSF